MTPDPRLAATANQNAASDPDRNIWLVANAGSGKTRVLTDRVARLLLRGVDPQDILCLTYTKAAAAEMQNRLFARLGEWAMAPDARLRDSLAALDEGHGLTPAVLALARQLFARAIETPGGLRIQTIHSFCASLLRRFPLEAGVSPAFAEMDDRAAALLRADLLEEAAGGPEAAWLEDVLPRTGDRLDELLRAIVQRRDGLAQAFATDGVRQAMGLPQGFQASDLIGMVFDGSEAAMLAAVIPALQAGKATDQKNARKLTDALPHLGTAAGIRLLEGVLLSGKNDDPDKAFKAKIGSVPTKDVRGLLGVHLAPLEALMTRVEGARSLRLALAAADEAGALHRFAAAFLARYEAAKLARGWLDFDDLITKATALLTDPAVAPWVLYRLDGSLDHVLVDEAQDTSPAQWRIVRALTAEAVAGEGARAARRSLFVVGDKKQSIYSFQGADVAAFDAVRGRFARAFADVGGLLEERPLDHSFRSSPAILTAVDAVFAALPGDVLDRALGGGFRHLAFRAGLAGRVDLWPAVPKAEKPDKGDWSDPVDLRADNDEDVVLARQVAARLADLLAAGTQVPADAEGTEWRAIGAGDILVLVQRRGSLFDALIREMKAAGLPVAGPDRINLSAELPVCDVLAVLHFLNTPEDDLALATALRSPLFGWSEAQLYALAQGRRGTLWDRLESPAREVLQDLRDQSDFLRPHDLIERLLTRHGGRRRLLGRLGPEAADALDELLSQALAYERTGVPSLTGFLVWIAADEIAVKRQAEGAGSVIRVMTVHGAKGMEAPVVVLPDTDDRRLDDRDPLLAMPGGPVVWQASQADNPPPVLAAKQAAAVARQDENLRLLYVAMTRAKHWLIVAGAGACGAESWHGRVAAAMPGLGAVALNGGVLRHGFGDWPDPLPDASGPVAPAPEALPGWVWHPAAPPPPGLRRVSPSALGGDFLEGPGEEDGRERGVRLHLLLQHLPGGADPVAMARQLGAEAELAEAQAILADPALAWIFGAGSLAEVSVGADWGAQRIEGSIDRLVVEPGRIRIVDFKSGRHVPAGADQVPEVYLRQLGAYAHAAGAIWPGRAVEVAILWTAVPLLMPLDREMVRMALSRAATA